VDDGGGEPRRPRGERHARPTRAGLAAQSATLGRTGAIGSVIVNELLANRHTVTAYARNPTKVPAEFSFVEASGPYSADTSRAALSTRSRYCSASAPQPTPCGRPVWVGLVAHIRTLPGIWNSRSTYGDQRISARRTATTPTQRQTGHHGGILGRRAGRLPFTETLTLTIASVIHERGQSAPWLDR
jgi:hypothetical protein